MYLKTEPRSVTVTCTTSRKTPYTVYVSNALPPLPLLAGNPRRDFFYILVVDRRILWKPQFVENNGHKSLPCIAAALYSVGLQRILKLRIFSSRELKGKKVKLSLCLIQPHWKDPG